MGVSKTKRTTTAIERERIQAIKDRLDAAITEHHRMRDELDALERRPPLDALREALRRQLRRIRRTNRVGG
jgi:hypothetical protein